ncbi:hypothetical protein GBAR_LOCUS2942, partial [Geodia barretti]
FLIQGPCIKQLSTHSPGSQLHSLVSRDIATKSCIELEAEGTMKTALHRAEWNCYRALVLASLLLFSIQWVCVGAEFIVNLNVVGFDNPSNT